MAQHLTSHSGFYGSGNPWGLWKFRYESSPEIILPNEKVAPNTHFPGGVPFGRTFRVGDRVLQSVNNYDKDVFNGDLGWVSGVDHVAGRVTVNFEGTGLDYDFSELDELQPSFAMTVHRAQGSEFPAVVVPVLTQHYPMLQRNLLYTAITRGRRLVVVVGSRRALAMAARNDRPGERNSMLGLRLSGTETGGGTALHV